MDYFQHRYYRLLEVMLTIIGQWPHQSQFHSWAFIALACLVGGSMLVPLLTTTLNNRDNLVIVMESSLVFNFSAVVVGKGACSKWNERKVFELLDRIRIDWQVWALDEEINILHAYADQGRRTLLRILLLFWGFTTAYMVQPAVVKIMDIVLKNGSAPAKLPLYVEYYSVDEQKYYFYIVAHMLLALYLALLLSMPFGGLYIISVYHGCAIFAAVGHKLNIIGENEGTAESEGCESELKKKYIDSEYLAMSIKRHNEAIEYADLIESTFNWSFLFTNLFYVLLVSCCGYQVVKGTNTLAETIRCVVCISSALVFIGMECYMAQILTDHSTAILHSIHSSKWYEQTSKVQQVLYFIMMRCNKSCELTAGKISTISVETFLRIIKTSMSCLTVVRSM